MNNTIRRKKRSEKLTTDERRQFKKYVDSFDTKYDCVLELNISRPTLDNVIAKGSGKPETIQLIREAIKEQAHA